MFHKDKEGVVIEVLSKYTYLLMLMNLWHGYWKNQWDSMNMKLYEDNCKAAGMANGKNQKFWRLSSNKFWNNIGCLVSAPTFGLGESRPWEK